MPSEDPMMTAQDAPRALPSRDTNLERRNKIILEALTEARALIGLAAPVRVLGKIDHAISLMQRDSDCDAIDIATEAYGDREVFDLMDADEERRIP